MVDPPGGPALAWPLGACGGPGGLMGPPQHSCQSRCKTKNRLRSGRSLSLSYVHPRGGSSTEVSLRASGRRHLCPRRLALGSLHDLLAVSDSFSHSYQRPLTGEYILQIQTLLLAGLSVRISSLSPVGPFPSLHPLLISKGLVAREEVTLAGGRQETGPGPPKEAPALTPKTLPRPPSSPPRSHVGVPFLGAWRVPCSRAWPPFLVSLSAPPTGPCPVQGPAGHSQVCREQGHLSSGGLDRGES